MLDDKEIDALEFVGRLYTEATKFARRYELKTKKKFDDWFTELNDWLP